MRYAEIDSEQRGGVRAREPERQSGVKGVATGADSPQTSEHLAAIEIMRLKHIVILQNKIDLVKESAATEQYKQIVKFVGGTYIPLAACGGGASTTSRR